MSLRKNIVRRFFDTLSNDGVQDHDLILFTSSGTISGRVPTDKDCDGNPLINAILSACTQEADSYRSEIELPKDNALSGEEGYLCLVDAKLISSTRPISLPFVIVFFDQITGVSFGKID